MTELETKRLERTFLNALRLLVERTADAKSGIVTKDKQQAMQQANKLMMMAQTPLLDAYLSEYTDEEAPDLTEDEQGDPEVTFDA